MIKVRAEVDRIRKTKAKDYFIRFVFGGLVTACAGLLAHLYGPVVGGLFLAFPAIAPASMTLVQNHDSRIAAGAQSLGVAVGSVGLLSFALVVWGLSIHLAGSAVLSLALVVWLVVSVGLWFALARAVPLQWLVDHFS
jgi:hypothetical protein